MESLKKRALMSEIKRNRYTLGGLSRAVIHLSAIGARPDFVELATRLLKRVPPEAYDESLTVFDESGILRFMNINVKKQVKEATDENDDMFAC